MKMVKHNSSVLISGASFAGLATAYWMNKLGYAVTVVEIATDLKKGGTPVDIRGEVINTVKRMGLLERIAAHSLKPRPMQLLNASGDTVAMMAAKAQDDEGPIAEYEIERDVLLEMLFKEVDDKVEIIYADSISSLEQSPEEVCVTFASGVRRSFSVVVGCDGTHSGVRKMCFGEEASFSLFMQNYFSLTVVDKLLIEENTAQMFNVPGKTVMLNAYNSKTDIAFAFFSENEIPYDRRDLDQQKNLILQHFKGERWRIPELLAELNRSESFYFDKLCQIHMNSWSKGRVALVGDAAYCPSPTAGMGGSMAILGAAAFADALQSHPDDLRMAFQKYDKSFRPTVAQIQADAIGFGMEMVMPRTEEALQRRHEQLRSM